MEKKLAKKAVGGFVWQILALATQVFLNLIFIAILGRLVSPAAFGIVAILRVFLGFIEMFTEFGFGAALIQRENFNQKHVSSAFYTTLFIALFFYSLIYLGSTSISNFYEGKFSPILLKVFCLVLIFKAFGVVSRSLMIRDFRFKHLFYAIFISNLVGNIFIGIPLAWYGYGVWSLIIAMVSTNALTSIILFGLKPHSLRFQFAKKEFFEIFKFGADLTFLRLFTQIGMQLDKLILGKFFDIGILGKYERSQYLVQLPKAVLGGALSNVAFSTFSRLQKNLNQLRETFISYLSCIIFLMLFLCQFFFFYPEQILKIMLGNQWLSAAPFVKILSIYAFLQTFTRFIDPLIRARNAMRQAIPIKMIFALLIVIVLTIGVQYNDIIFISYLILLPMLIHGLLMLMLSFRLIQAKIQDAHTIFKPSYILILYFLLKVFFFQILDIYFKVDLNTISFFILGALHDILFILLILLKFPQLFGEKNIFFVLTLFQQLPLGKKFKAKFFKE